MSNLRKPTRRDLLVVIGRLQNLIGTAMAQNDALRVESVVHYYLALQQAKVPAELHLYPTGGHGYGLRRTEHYVTTWPDRATDWLRSRKLLERK